jgi:hypothetical protein
MAPNGPYATEKRQGTAGSADGYGATGVQATAVRFPTPGCWKVVGNVGDARLTFVVRVTARRG